MVKFIPFVLIFVFAGSVSGHHIHDKFNLLSEQNSKALELKFQRIREEAALNFIVFISSESDRYQLEENDVLISISPATDLLTIQSGQKVVSVIGEDIAYILKEGMQPLIDEHLYFEAIDYGLNNITYQWLEKYHNKARNDLQEKIVLMVLLALFILFALYIRRVLKPFQDSERKKWEVRWKRQYFDQFKNKDPNDFLPPPPH